MSTPLSMESEVPQPVYHYLSSAQQRTMIVPSLGEINYCLTVAQEPRRSRMCGVGEKHNRRPIGPVPAVALMLKNSTTGQLVISNFTLCDNADLNPALDTMTLLCEAVLIRHDTREPVPMIYNRGQSLNPLVGVRNVSHHKVSNSSGDSRFPLDPFAVFAFPDLSVRHEGLYCLMFYVYEICGDEFIHRAAIKSNTFRVYPAKEYPGMPDSTPFTELLKAHGIRVRVTKAQRAKRAFLDKRAIQEWQTQEFDPDPIVTDSETIADEQTGRQRYSPPPPPEPRVEPLLPLPAHSGPSTEVYRRPGVYDYQPAYSPTSRYGMPQGVLPQENYSNGNYLQSRSLPPIVDFDPRPQFTTGLHFGGFHGHVQGSQQVSRDEHPNGHDRDGHQHEPPPFYHPNQWDSMDDD